jgi:hypothetical protein
MNIFTLWNRGRGAVQQPRLMILPLAHLRSFKFAAGQNLTCESGVVWLTQSGDGHDHILRAGQSFVARRRGRIVVQAMEDAVLRLHSTAPSSNVKTLRCKAPRLRAARSSSA